MKHALAVLSILLILGGCSNARRLHVEERALGTDGPITHQFHSALYYPFELTPRFDGYLVGIEKVRRPTDGIMLVDDSKSRYGIDNGALRSKLNDGKVMAITHVIRHSADARATDNCTVFNGYVQPGGDAGRQLIGPCDLSTPARRPEHAYQNSWDALELLERNMTSRLKSAWSSDSSPETSRITSDARPYSHILVIVMGWNTAQEEAVRNVNSITWNLHRAYREVPSTQNASAFNPLVIAVTWPSQWSSSWLDPAIKVVSFPNKAADADEVGMTWLGQLLHHTIPEVQKALERPKGHEQKVIVVGHSFGARATSIAACGGPAIVRNAGDMPTQLAHVHTLVNLQPAYLATRVFGPAKKPETPDAIPASEPTYQGREDHVVYPHKCDNVGRFVLTASKGDEAVTVPIWGTYVGDAKSYEAVCGANRPEFDFVNCSKASARGDVTPRRAARSQITYVDASELISENAFGTGGGSHSDIYRLEHGRMLRDIIEGTGGFAKAH